MATVLECYATGPFTALTAVTLIDSQSLQPEVLPAGSIVTEVFAHADTAFSGVAAFEVGWAGSAGALVALTDGCSATGLNTADWHKTLATTTAPTADQTLTVTGNPVLSVTGQIHLKIVYWSFGNR
jgi:hypothetical protein